MLACVLPAVFTSVSHFIITRVLDDEGNREPFPLSDRYSGAQTGNSPKDKAISHFGLWLGGTRPRLSLERRGACVHTTSSWIGLGF